MMTIRKYEKSIRYLADKLRVCVSIFEKLIKIKGVLHVRSTLFLQNR